MDQHTLLIYGLIVLAAACVCVIAAPYLTGGIKAEKRRQAIEAPRAKRSNVKAIDAATRRKQVTDSLKDLDQRKAKKPSLEIRIQQAGLTWSKTTYFGFAALAGVVLGGALYAFNGSPWVAGAAGVVGVFGLPSWVLGFLRKRRLAKFSDGFANAVDVVIRGVKAGLPLGDCLRVIASESPEPLRSEFRRIVESTAVGLTVTEAVERFAERVPVSETGFFAIVIGIQQKAGGNLTEALANLSRVIRERKKMKAKIRAMSAEAKSSAGIIGALPFVVGGLVYVTSPDYMSLLFTTSTGHLIMMACGCWMGIGVAIMKKMINFDI